MGMVIGQQAEMYANSRNEARVIRSEQRSTDFAREKKASRRQEKEDFRNFYKESLFYGPGVADWS